MKYTQGRYVIVDKKAIAKGVFDFTISCKEVADVALMNTPTTEKAATILNFPVAGAYSSCIILPDAFTGGAESPDRPNSDGSSTEQDGYLTDPVPEGKPLPVEPGGVADQTKVYSCACAMKKNPACMLFANPIDSLAAAGAVLADVWVDGVTMPVVDSLGDEFLHYVKDGMTITVKDGGMFDRTGDTCLPILCISLEVLLGSV